MLVGELDHRGTFATWGARTHAPAGASLAQQRAEAFVAAMTEGGAEVTAEVVVHGPTVISNLQRLCGPHNRARTPSAQAGARGRPR